MSSRREIWLLVTGGMFILTNQIALIIADERSPAILWMVALWILGAAVGVSILDKLLPYRDPYLFPATMFLTGWGLNLVSRLLPGFAARQTVWMVLGLGILLAICTLPDDLRWLQGYRYTWLIAGLGLLLATILLGVNPSGGGPRLWLGFEGMFFQPSEALKVLLVVFLASYLAEHQITFRIKWRSRLPSPRYLGPILLMWSLSIIILIWQRELGTATIFFVVFMLLIYVASGEIMLLPGGAALLLAGGWGASYVFDVVALRVRVWLNPWADSDGSAFQVIQSLLAIASGGIIGTGVGQGEPNFIPVVHTDFAYAAIVEEWGLIGGLAVMLGILIIILRGLRIATLLQENPFHAYLATGLCLMLAVQSLLITAGTLNLVPLTGITLPFVSYGGSSLVTSFAMVGLLLVLSQKAVVHDTRT